MIMYFPLMTCLDRHIIQFREIVQERNSCCNESNHTSAISHVGERIWMYYKQADNSNPLCFVQQCAYYRALWDKELHSVLVRTPSIFMQMQAWINRDAGCGWELILFHELVTSK